MRSPTSTASCAARRSRPPGRSAALEKRRRRSPARCSLKDTSHKSVFPVFTQAEVSACRRCRRRGSPAHRGRPDYLARPALGAENRLAAVRPPLPRRQAGAFRHARAPAHGAREARRPATGSSRGWRSSSMSSASIDAHLRPRTPASPVRRRRSLLSTGYQLPHRVALRPDRAGAGDPAQEPRRGSACRCAPSRCEFGPSQIEFTLGALAGWRRPTR